MTNEELAQELIKRLNKLCKDPHARKLVRDLIETRVNVSEALAPHPTIQVQVLNDGIQDYYQVGFLGLLNGLVGVLPKRYGDKAGWGHLSAIFSDDSTELQKFVHTSKVKLKKS